MTHTLACAFRRSKNYRQPEYQPPYFWHRYYVWRYLLPAPTLLLVVELIDLTWPERASLYDLFISLIITLCFYPIPYLIRRRWITREGTRLSSRLDAWAESSNASAYEIGEAKSRFTWLAHDLKDYAFRPFSPLSIRRTPWEGGGSRYVVYQKHRLKRTYTFFHD